MFGNLSIWLTSIWVLSVGVTLGAAVLVLLYAALLLVSRPAAAAMLRVIKESVLQWISYIVLAYVVICFLAIPMMPVKQLFASLGRLPHVGENAITVEVPPRTDDMEVPLGFQSDELQRYSIRSEQDVIVGVEAGQGVFQSADLGRRRRTVRLDAQQQTSIDCLKGRSTRLYVTNQSDAPTQLTIEITTDVPIVAGAADFLSRPPRSSAFTSCTC